MAFALTFFLRKSVLNCFHMYYKVYFSRHNEAQALNGSEISSSGDNIHPCLSYILQETKSLLYSRSEQF